MMYNIIFIGINITKNSEKLLGYRLKSWQPVGYNGQRYMANGIYDLIQIKSNFGLFPLTSNSFKEAFIKSWTNLF